MIVTVFRASLNPDTRDEYFRLVARLNELAETMPGYISHKRFNANDGERVSIVEFESAEAQRAWAAHPEHIAAMKLGRQSYFTEYSPQICRIERTTAKHPRLD
jgi:heme-degrading monooxygenase HmoA